MPDELVLNYPDVLGYITNGVRLSISAVQVALAVRPRIVRAGRPFEVLLLVQNASDADVDVSVLLHLPELDAARKKGRFVTKAPKLLVGLAPAEVGYIKLPVSCLPDTAPSAEYKIAMEVRVALASKGTSKAKQVRDGKGGSPVEPRFFNPDTARVIKELQVLQFSAHKRLSGAIEASFSVMSGKLGEIADLKPGWVSLWTLKDHHDDRLLLHRFQHELKDKVLPRLKRMRVYDPMVKAVRERFEKGGYPLSDFEASLVARFLTLLLEYAAPSEVGDGANYGGLEAGVFSIAPMLTPERLADPRPIVLPQWANAFLRFLAVEPRAADHPIEAITRMQFNDLLRDAISHAFALVERHTGEELGDEDEVRVYGEQIIEHLQKGTMDFNHAYMPLLMGAALSFDAIILKDDRIEDMANQVGELLNRRASERNEDTEPVFELLNRSIDRALSRYGRGSVGEWSKD